MKFLKAGLLVVLFATSSTAAIAEGDREVGKNKSANCMGCHGG